MMRFFMKLLSFCIFLLMAFLVFSLGREQPLEVAQQSARDLELQSNPADAKERPRGMQEGLGAGGRAERQGIGEKSEEDNVKARRIDIALRGIDETRMGQMQLQAIIGGKVCCEIETRPLDRVSLDLGSVPIPVSADRFTITLRAQGDGIGEAVSRILVPEGWWEEQDPVALKGVLSLVSTSGIVFGILGNAGARHARVELYGLYDGIPGDRPLSTTHAASGMGFELGIPAPGEYVVVLYEDARLNENVHSFRPWSHRILAMDGANFDLGEVQLSGGEVLEGLVILNGLEPHLQGRVEASLTRTDNRGSLQNNMIWVDDRFEWEVNAAIWSESGKFVICGLCESGYRVVCRSGRPVAEQEFPILLVNSLEQSVWNLRAPSYGLRLGIIVYKLTVFVTSNGNPVPQANVAIVQSEGSQMRGNGLVAETDGTARLQLDSMEPVSLRIHDPDSGAHRELLFDPTEIPSGGELVVELEDGPAFGRVEVQAVGWRPGGAVTAVVDVVAYNLAKIDPRGNRDVGSGLSSFMGSRGIVLLQPSIAGQLPELSVNREGTYEIDPLPPGHYLLRVSPRSQRPMDVCLVLPKDLEVVVSEGDTSLIVWNVELGGRLRLNVSGASGREHLWIENSFGERVGAGFHWVDPLSGGETHSTAPNLFGDSEVSPVFSEGTYRLKGTSEFGDIERAFEIQGGQATLVSLDLKED